MTRAPTVPGNHVIGLVRGAATAAVLAEEMIERGLDAPILVSGERLTDKLEAETGLIERALQRLFSHLSEETSYLHQYEEAVRRGQTVVAVKAEGIDDVKLAKSILDKYGALDVRFFGRLVISDMTPAGDPSAASGDH
jgi:hypothetical protein